MLRRLFFLSLLLLALPPAAAARSLHWRAFDVDARLDADGRLLVVERHAMVFDGDWNGGARAFALRVGQDVDLHAVTRVDPATGTRRQLVGGDLDAVDHFDWADGKTLRWRSRLPSDPPYASEEIIYVLEYTLSGVLRERRGRYLLSHDFAPIDRVGPIERFTLDLDLDGAWREIDPLPAHLERLDLDSGHGVPLEARLAYEGEGRPAAIFREVPLVVRYAAFAAVFVLIGWLFSRFRRHEKERGRFEDVPVPAELDRAFLEEHLLCMRPEEAGAIWDQKIGAPEVAAVIARLVGEGKLESSVREEKKFLGTKKVLALKLLVERGLLDGYERKLVDKLFFNKRTETDTEAVRQHYKDRGFDPAGVIRPALAKRMRKLAGRQPKRRRSKLPWLLFGAVVALMGLEGLTRGDTAGVLLAVILVTAPLPLIVGSIFASVYRTATHGLALWSLGFLLPALVLTAALFLASVAEAWLGLAVVDFYPGLFGILALAVFPAWLASAWCSVARTRDAPAAVRLRRRLAEIRLRFVAELHRREPDLDDAWYPYLLAFGLDRHVDGWFTSFGGERHARSSSYGSSFASSSSSGGRWTGGGGAFGGAGASATWAAAATGLASGVPSPSSSGGSSGGGGGGGGSFSGGGGGGGW